MISDYRYLRQQDLVPLEKLNIPITVIGAGAIGSAAVVALAKMGCSNLTVWDDDLLEEVNIPNQLCRTDMVGKPKVEALAELTKNLTDTQIQTENRRYHGQRLLGLVVAAVDSMEGRQSVWKRSRLNPLVELLIDARMGAEFARVYAIRPMDSGECDFYEENLYGAHEAERLPCSARSIIYCPTIIGGLVALIVKKYALGERLPREILFDQPRFQLLASA